MQNTNTTNNAGIIVSFCIPVYNNAKAAQIMVESLLRSDDSRFEVVVSDDNSRENVGELLSGIRDSRFRYYRNEKNLGAHKNWEHSLELGRGDWLYLIMGRDMVHGEYITRLIELLEYARKNNITFLRDGYRKDLGDGIQVFSGINAMLEFTRVLHPTGDIYHGEIFREIPNRTRYYEIADMYPENYIRHYLLLRGNGAHIMSNVHIFENFYSPFFDFSKVKSGVESGGDIFNVHFSPRRRTIQNLELIDMIDGDPAGTFTQDERDLYFSTRFNNIMDYAYRIWQNWCYDRIWMSHYGHKTRHVSIRERLCNIFTACKTVKFHLREKGTLTPERRKVIYTCGIRTAMRDGFYLPAKNRAKKILEPLGIWSILKGLKRLIKGEPPAMKA